MANLRIFYRKQDFQVFNSYPHYMVADASKGGKSSRSHLSVLRDSLYAAFRLREGHEPKIVVLLLLPYYFLTHLIEKP